MNFTVIIKKLIEFSNTNVLRLIYSSDNVENCKSGSAHALEPLPPFAMISIEFSLYFRRNSRNLLNSCMYKWTRQPSYIAEL